MVWGSLLIYTFNFSMSLSLNVKSLTTLLDIKLVRALSYYMQIGKSNSKLHYSIK